MGVFWRIFHHHRFDKVADDRCVFAGLFAFGDRLAEERDAPAIGLHNRRMQDQRRKRLMLGELGLCDGELLAPIGDRVLHFAEVGTYGDCVDQALDFKFQVIDPFLRRA
ncbi:hypothetical protein NDN01_10190 [Sphingomonas sp. QA11]|uniref:hypothetical protein n=1 Tax=Sphingomonas sp. QA11 TaxID=2950605 RepID=UPI00234AC603|nr:hypothetical protein [Sphingomonas sp. QA11]WCM29221.1 hypothetical protein NDN01_10190 [Sphingomonas sp. QA11]